MLNIFSIFKTRLKNVNLILLQSSDIVTLDEDPLDTLMLFIV